jgi:hypothetical protein
VFEVPAAMADLFPEKSLRRGSTVALQPLSGGCSLALALAASATSRGEWAAVVGIGSLGLVAAVEMGVDLGRLVLVPDPGERWPAVVAALLDGFGLVVLRPPAAPGGVEARRLVARVRERGAVLALLDAAGWPESPDLRLTVRDQVWEGLGVGHGRLACRRVEVACGGRRAAGRERVATLWLPSSDGLPSAGGGRAGEAGGGRAGAAAAV